MARMAIRALDLALRALPRPARTAVAAHMSDSVHSVLGRVLAVGPVLDVHTSL